MPPSQKNRRETALASAVALVLNKNYTLTRAVEAVRNGINVTTLHRRVKDACAPSSGIRKKAGRPCALTPHQESAIAQLCLHYAALGSPVTKDEIGTLVQENYGSIASLATRFKNGKPGKDWLNGFCKRNNLSFKKPRRQAAERYAATNAEVLTTHLSSLSDIYADLNLDAQRVFNLDECGSTPGKDCHGASKKKGIMLKNTRCDRKGTEFVSTLNRVTLMACVSASGEAVLPFWIFKGKQTPFRKSALPDGSFVRESVSSVLPSGSIIACREDQPGINTKLFIFWCKKFVERLSYLTTNGRKVLLTYDGYRAHMSFKALQTLSAGNVEAYALPAHTSGATQPLDVSVFSPFKAHINEHLYETTSSLGTKRGQQQKVSQFDLCVWFNIAYNLAFSRHNILKGFEKTGTWPYNPSKLLSRSLPRSANNLSDIVSVEELSNMLHEKRNNRSSRSSEVSFKRGFVDTTSGALLTSDTAMTAGRNKERDEFKKKLEKGKRMADCELKRQRERENAQRVRGALEKKSLEWRAKKFGLDVNKLKLPRSFAERRAIARARPTEKRLVADLGRYQGASY